MNEKSLSTLADRIAIEDVICAVTLHSDLDEPEMALAQYIPGAEIDYGAVFDGNGSTVPVEEHRQNLDLLLPGFDKRQHQVTNFDIKITGDEAIARSQCSAVHILDREVWLARGTYYHHLRRTDAGWRITYQRVDMVQQEGEHLVEKARQRVALRKQAECAGQ